MYIWHTFGTKIVIRIFCADLVPKLCLKWSFLGLDSVLNPKGLDTKKTAELIDSLRFVRL